MKNKEERDTLSDLHFIPKKKKKKKKKRSRFGRSCTRDSVRCVFWKTISFKEPVTFARPNFSFRSPPEVGRFSRQFRRIHRFIGSSFDSEFRAAGGEAKEGWRLRLFSAFLDAFQKVVAETDISLSLSLFKRWLLCCREFLRIFYLVQFLRIALKFQFWINSKLEFSQVERLI